MVSNCKNKLFLCTINVYFNRLTVHIKLPNQIVDQVSKNCNLFDNNIWFKLPFFFLRVFTRLEILVDISTNVFVYYAVLHLRRTAVNLHFSRVKRDTPNIFIILISGCFFESYYYFVFVKIGCDVFNFIV